ncbi:MAG: hypothetical protein H6719_06385 [Sandaracinaceae bacterium]|nr:hypothetical protein [Sandaracinaceae bacterium]
MILAALAGALMIACGADVGESGTRLVIDEAQVTSETLYMLPDVSQVPYTLAELNAQGIDPTEAIPVRVEVFENVAVAWFAPDGVARIGGDWIIALWSVERVAISDETARGDAPEITTPGTYYNGADINVEARPSYDIQLTNVPEHAGAIAIVDFLDRLGTAAELELYEELITHHPGCE